jgi:hypothetical protein
MKKVIRLTESDLYRIVKRVISEQVPPNGRTQTSTTNTTTTTTRRPQDPLARKKMNVYWHAEQIYKLLAGLRAQTNIFTIKPITLENIPENIYRVFKISTPTSKNIHDMLDNSYLIPLGKLVDPNDSNPRELGLKLLDAYSIKNPNLFPNKELVYKIGETPVGKRLMARIAQVKNQDAPN